MGRGQQVEFGLSCRAKAICRPVNRDRFLEKILLVILHLSKIFSV